VLPQHDNKASWAHMFCSYNACVTISKTKNKTGSPTGTLAPCFILAGQEEPDPQHPDLESGGLLDGVYVVPGQL